MNTTKVIGGSVGAIIILILAQSAAVTIADGLSHIHLSAALCNACAGIFYLFLTGILLKLFAEKILKINAEQLGMSEFRLEKRWGIVGVLLPVGVTACYLLMPGHFIKYGIENGTSYAALSAGIFFTGIAAGFVEEMVFRGFILHLLDMRWNRIIAVVVPSVLFSVLHLVGTDFTLLSCALVIVSGTAVGMMFSLIALESGSVWNGGLVHALWNIIIIGNGLCISDAVNPNALITYIPNTRNILLTGGSFGIESSVTALVGYSIVSYIAFSMLKNKA